jgi:hypothetical protein
MDQRQFEATLADAEIRLRRLRTLYDQWFHGLERTEPRTQRTDVDKLIAALRREQPRNTALRFRFNQLVQRYTTYNTFWQRITRQIEEGTYKRDVLRARRRMEGAKERSPRSKDSYELDLDIDIEAALDSMPPSQAPAESPSRPPSRPPSQPPSTDRPLRSLREITPFALPTDMLIAPIPSMAPLRLGLPPAARSLAPQSLRVPVPPLPPGASRKPPPLPPGVSRNPPALPPAVNARSTASLQPSAKPSARPSSRPGAKPAGVTDDQIRNIYQRYVEARRQNSERTDNVKLESVAKTVRDMIPKLEQKHAGKHIEFEVVVKDGRVALKPVAK